MAGETLIQDEARPVVRGWGDLVVRSRGHRPGAFVLLTVGDREIELRADASGLASWTGPGLLAEVAGEVKVAVDARSVSFVVQPNKLVAEAISALVTELEAVAEGLSLSAGAVSTVEGVRSRDRELSLLEMAVGLAASAAPAIRRRPLHRAREEVWAAPAVGGPRTARDVRWLATHPVASVRAAATGRSVGVRRERRADLDTLENRGVLTAYDRLDAAATDLRARVSEELGRLEAGREAREAFVTEHGNLWQERDAPRALGLERRRARIDELRREIAAIRLRAGLPDLRPRGPRMLRTPRVDAEPAYWTTFRAFLIADGQDESSVAPAPIRALDELWEQWCTVVVARALGDLLGAWSGTFEIDPGWFSTLARGEVATWTQELRTVRLLYEPEIGREGEIRKLHPGRPWRPDLVVEVRWIDGSLDLHVLDAKFRREAGGPPWTALQEVWWKYGEGIGDASGQPLVRSVWVLWPGEGARLVGPAMLKPGWPEERLRGGTIGLWPGTPSSELARALTVVLGRRPTLPGHGSRAPAG